ncbi:MAG TPA: hypothetical protein VF989_09605 [Polyangiaceae bacterium]|jgi:hypothetical protein
MRVAILGAGNVGKSLGPRALAPLRPLCAGVGQAHPLVSFPDSMPASLEGALLLLDGDTVANRRARPDGSACRRAACPGFTRTATTPPPRWSRTAARPCARRGIELLVRAGMPRTQAARALGPLLWSVAEHVGRLGLPAALTGRSGVAISRPWRGTAARSRASSAGRVAPLQTELLRLQVPLARALGEAAPEDLERLVRLLAGR